MVGLRDLLDEAAREEGPADDPSVVVRAGRRRVRRRGVMRGAALSLVVLTAATTMTVRPWEGAPEQGLDPVAPSDPTLSPDAGTEPPVTTPGTRLDIGETATVPVQHLRPGVVELTVTRVRRGDRDDILAVPDLDPSASADARRGEFWYVDVTITHVSGRIGGYYLDPDVEATSSRGQQVGQWHLDSDFSPCTPRGLPRHPEAGDSVRDCLIFQARPGDEVVGLAWGQFATEYDLTDGDPVTWR